MSDERKPSEAAQQKVRFWRNNLHMQHGPMRAGAPSDEDIALLLQSALDAAAAEAYERAARLCVTRSVSWSDSDDKRSLDFREGIEHAASQLALAIRALAKKETER